MGGGLELDGELAHGLAESAPDAVLVVDLDGRIVFANAQVETMFGHAHDELLGQRVELLIPERFREAHVAHRAGFSTAKHARRMGEGLGELVGRRSDGTEFPVEVSLSPVSTSKGTFYAAAVRDATERRRIERTLRDAEERFRIALDEAPIGIALVSLDGRFLRVNHALSSIVGYPPDELMTLNFQAITHAEDVDVDVDAARRLAAGEITRYQRAKRYVRKDGGTVNVALSVSVARARDGAPVYYITQIEDVSERVRTEQALRRSEEGLNRAQSVAHLGSWDRDLRTNTATCSAEMLAIYGVAPTAAHDGPDSLSQFIHPDDRERVIHAVDRVAREGGWFSVEHRIVRPDGTVRVVLQQGESTSEDGRPVHLVGTCLDITERKRAEREREDSLRWMRAVLEQSPVGLILVHGPDGERAEANSRAQRMVGGPVVDNHRYSFRVCTPDGRPLERDSLPSVRALRGERIDDTELLLTDPSGGSTPVLVSSAPIVGSNAAVLGAVVAFQDIRAAKELERLRAEWGSVVAHELRQPLGTISLNAQTLARVTDDPRLERPIERIRSAAHRLDRMVGELMDLTRLEARRLELVRQRIDVRAAVSASVERMALEAPDRPFDVHVHGEVPDAHADPDRIEQVLENLLSNAVKYGTPGTPVAVVVSREGDEVTVAVANEGKALAGDELSRIFERFQRTDSAKAQRIKGTGLGLYIARALVEAHGGRITAECSPQGRITFRFTLPAA